jgi:hypothetical protein
MRIAWDVPIRMSDGNVLRGDVFRPDDGGRYPVILGVGPYGKWLQFQDAFKGQWEMMLKHEPGIVKHSTNKYQSYEYVDPERFVPDGYAVVRVDVRGSGRSPGMLDMACPRENQDYYEIIEWCAAQPWSTGKVGLSGVSYLGMNQWWVAALRPPHLTAMCPWEGCSDFYREFIGHGGILGGFNDLWVRMYVHPVQHGLGERGYRSSVVDGQWVSGPVTLSDQDLEANRRDWRVSVRKHKLAADAFWKERMPDFSKIEVPVLSAANWGGQGLHLRGNVEGFTRSASKERWLNFHCFEHWTEYYTDAGIELQKRFFGHFLKGEDTGWRAEPRVQMQVRHPAKSLSTRSDPEWPLKGTQWTRFYLDPARSSLEMAPGAAEAKVTFAASSDGLTFVTAPLEKETHVIGPAAAKLFVSSSTEDTDLFLVLRVFSPDFREAYFSGSNDPHTPMALGWLRASQRKLDPKLSLPYRPYHAHDEVQKLAPGKPYELDIELWPTCIVVPAGYRIALSVRGKDYVYPGDLSAGAGKIGQPATGVGPFTHAIGPDRPAELYDNQTTLHFGAKSTPYLLLPVVPA